MRGISKNNDCCEYQTASKILQRHGFFSDLLAAARMLSRVSRLLLVALVYRAEPGGRAIRRSARTRKRVWYNIAIEISSRFGTTLEDAMVIRKLMEFRSLGLLVGLLLMFGCNKQ